MHALPCSKPRRTMGNSKRRAADRFEPVNSVVGDANCERSPPTGLGRNSRVRDYFDFLIVSSLSVFEPVVL